MLRLPEAGLLEIMPGDHPDYEVKSLALLSLLTLLVQCMEFSLSIDIFFRGPLVRFFIRVCNKVKSLSLTFFFFFHSNFVDHADRKFY